MYNIARNRNMGHGYFIVVDGPSASGKDSIIKQVLKDLKTLGKKASAIEETKEKNYSRSKILKAKGQGNKKVAQAIIEERKKLYQKKVIPQLKPGKILIANRGEPTTLGYQTIGNNVSMEEVWAMHRAKNIPLPDLVVLTNCSVEEAIRRENSRKPSEKINDLMSGKFTSDRKLIHQNYENVKNFLEKKGIDVIYINTKTMQIPQISRKTVSLISARL